MSNQKKLHLESKALALDTARPKLKLWIPITMSNQKKLHLESKALALDTARPRLKLWIPITMSSQKKLEHRVKGAQDLSWSPKDIKIYEFSP